ncbi:MAG TPA: 1-(5-phosphoribosyl)-5-[(5-phosphoribosylamino)methylideneamino]imidazole-4-carboxamide isomerase [Bacteroidales bacterium]|nr:1-(5-phosphoribosyl)-5-[(5-phosphoribosylamino)methylideneamino]imidazole-4-carboxamide isomerase [Bacteroidales bacterium]
MMRIIPAIDIINGKCVRLSQGNYAQMKTYNENPLEVAKAFEEKGFEYLHLVDLDGAKSSHIVNYKVLYKIANQTKLKIDFGGGIKENNDIQIAFDNGANQVTGGSISIKHPEIFIEWLNLYGADKIILGADCLNRKIATNGWQQKSNIDVIDLIKNYEGKNIQYVISTDISKDGMMQGPAIELYQEIMAKTQVNLIASGGISSLNDIKILKEIGCEGIIIGKAIYEGKININEFINVRIK